MTSTTITTQGLDRIVALLDRLDPQPAVCDVHGCIHHAHHEPLALAVAGAGTV